MTTKRERDIYVFLSLYRFFAYGLAVILIQGLRLDDVEDPTTNTYWVLAIVGVYTMFKVLGPLRWRQADPSTYVVLGGDVVVALVVLLWTNGLDSPYLLYSLTPVISASLLFEERLALASAAVISVPIIVAHLTSGYWDTNYTWVMDGNYLLWLILYVTAAAVIASSVFRTNMNIRRRIQSDAMLDERRRLRREIHDGLAQSLTYLSMKTESVGRLIGEQKAAEARSALDEVSEVVQDTYQDVREAIDQLAVDRLPLVPALLEYVEEFQNGTGIQTHFDRPDESFPTPTGADFQLLRISQEALANIRRHANASEAWITLVAHSDAVELAVRDDGQGIEQPADSDNGTGHHGLQVMRERAESLGGTLDVTSEPGEGTEIRVRVPRVGLRG